MELNSQTTKPEYFKILEDAVSEVTRIRNRPLLLMFYSASRAGKIQEYDVAFLEKTFDDFLSKRKVMKFRDLDLVIQTYGGEANTAYRLIQLIRSYCDNLHVLVPTHSYSGGTLICFGADIVELGRSSTLSPIDVQLGDGESNFSLLSVEKYIEFLDDCTQKYKLKKGNDKAMFLTELTKQLTDVVSPPTLGDLFRLRCLTELHAKTLLVNYMFKNDSQRMLIAQQILARFTRETPTHSFQIDYELAKESGLKVIKMEQKVYIQLKLIIEMCTLLKRNGNICLFKNDPKIRMPYFDIFDMSSGGVKNGKK